METIQFSAIIDQEQIIRPPSGVRLPQGEIEVTVRPRIPAPAPSAADPLAHTREWLLALAVEAERSKPDLPVDLAQNHGHYAHGKPRS
jgi:hypothetical protein